MITPLTRAASCVAVIFLMLANSASALTIREWRKHDRDQQAVYVGSAVSMAAYMFASQGDPARGRCIMDFYFGKAGQETPGPHEIALELNAAEQRDADKYHIEGVILGVIDKMCPSTRH